MKKVVFLLLILGLCQTNELNAQAKQGQARIDSLLGLLMEGAGSGTQNKTGNLADTVKVKLMIDLAYDYLYINPDKGDTYTNQALKLAEKLKWKKGIANAIGTMGLICWSKGEYLKAQQYYLRELNLCEELRDKGRIAICLGNIGNVFLYQSDYPGALDYFLRSLKMHEELGEKKGVAKNLGNIGIVYASEGDFDKALEYYFKALKIDEELGDKKGVSGNLGSIGNVYNLQKDYSKALKYYLKSLELSEELGDKHGIATNESNIGSLYYNLRNYPEALIHLSNALNLHRELQEKNGMAGNLSNIGITYFSIATDSNKAQLNKIFSGNKEKVFLQAKNYTDSAAVMYKEMGDLNNLFLIYNNLSEINSFLGDHKAALEYYKLFTSTKDSVFNAENNKKLASLEAKREAEVKEKQLALARAEEDRKENIQLAGVGVFIILLIGGLLLVSKRKINSGIINVLSTFSVLLIFELVALLLHPHIIKITHHNLILTLIALVGVASIIIPLHHKAEHWMKEKLVRKEIHSAPVEDPPITNAEPEQ